MCEPAYVCESNLVIFLEVSLGLLHLDRSVFMIKRSHLSRKVFSLYIGKIEHIKGNKHTHTLRKKRTAIIVKNT